MLATPPSWLLALDRWLCVPAFQRVCSGSQVNMPKKPPRDKRGKAPMRTRAGLKSKGAHPVHSVKDLLARPAFALTRVSDQSGRQQFWDGWLRQRLGIELHAKISGISEQEGKLTVFAES